MITPYLSPRAEALRARLARKPCQAGIHFSLQYIVKGLVILGAVGFSTGSTVPCYLEVLGIGN